MPLPPDDQPRAPAPPPIPSIPSSQAAQDARIRKLERENTSTRARRLGDTSFEGTFDGSNWSDTSGASVSSGELVPDFPGRCIVVARWTVDAPAGLDPVDWSGSVYGLDGTGDVRGETGVRQIFPGGGQSISAHYFGLVAGSPAGLTVEGSATTTWLCRVRGERISTAEEA